MQSIRRSIQALRRMLPQVERPLAELTLVATGDIVLVFHDGAVFEAVSGQEWVFEVARFQREVDAWRKLRAAVLARRPLCEDPFGAHSAIGRPVASTVVDHVIPRSTRPDLELDERNLQALCTRCHNRKSRHEQSSPQPGAPGRKGA